jgi:predicted secreted acid phosphatase
MIDLIKFFENVPKTKKDIVFFDIDDTLLRPYINEPVKPVLDFYNYLVKNGYNVAIITARPYTDENLNYTINDLKSIGIENSYKYLILRNIYTNDIKEYKKEARKQIVNDGYIPLMSIGDMHWDMGEYGGIGILVLPDN